MDASPGANLSAVSQLPFVLDTRAPEVLAVTPAAGASLATGPQEIVLTFSEPMNRTAGHLGIADLVLSGAGVGTVTLNSADWIDDRTARFGITGQWGVGPVDVMLQGGDLQDRAGNAVRGFASRFTLQGSPAATLELPASQVNAGALVRVIVHNGPADPADRVGIYEVGASDGSPVDWLYLNGSQNPPAIGIATAELTFQAPRLSGSYEFRLFSRGQRIATSSTLLVTGVEIFLDFDGGYLADLAGVVEVNGSTGLDSSGIQPLWRRVDRRSDRSDPGRRPAGLRSVRSPRDPRRQLADRPALRAGRHGDHGRRRRRLGRRDEPRGHGNVGPVGGRHRPLGPGQRRDERRVRVLGRHGLGVRHPGLAGDPVRPASGQHDLARGGPHLRAGPRHPA